MYFYFMQGQQVIPNSLLYLPSTTNYIPFVVRKTYTVVNDKENVYFSTYYGQSYPVVIKNIMLTAQLQ